MHLLEPTSDSDELDCTTLPKKTQFVLVNRFLEQREFFPAVQVTVY